MCILHTLGVKKLSRVWKGFFAEHLFLPVLSHYLLKRTHNSIAIFLMSLFTLFFLGFNFYIQRNAHAFFFFLLLIFASRLNKASSTPFEHVSYWLSHFSQIIPVSQSEIRHYGPSNETLTCKCHPADTTKAE